MQTPLDTEDQFYEILAGCGKAMMLTSAVDLGLDQLLKARGPLTIAEIRAHYGLHELRGEKWVLLLAQVGLLVEHPQAGGETRYGVGPLLYAFNDPQVMYFYREFLRYWRVAVVRDTVAVIQGGPVDNPVRYPPQDDADVALLHDWMRSGAMITLEAIKRRFDFTGVSTILDVGGGDATMALALAKANPHLHVTVFNIPKVAALGRANIERADLGVRVGVYEGNFLEDELPRGYEMVMFSRVLADWPDAVCRRLLSQAFASLQPGGHLLIAEPFQDHNPALAIAWEHSYLPYDDFGAFVYKPTGYYHRLLEELGYTDLQTFPRGESIHGLILARKPAADPVDSEPAAAAS